MDGQQLAALAIVAGTAALMLAAWVRRMRRRRRSAGMPCGGCACSTGNPQARPTIRYRYPADARRPGSLPAGH